MADVTVHVYRLSRQRFASGELKLFDVAPSDVKPQHDINVLISTGEMEYIGQFQMTGINRGDNPPPPVADVPQA